MNNVIIRSWRKLFSFTATTAVKKYIQKDRKYRYKQLLLIILKDVFHPGLYRSTKVFSGWLAHQDLTNKKVLELGCGSGLLSLIAAGKGALTTAVDINPKAVENAKINASKNGLNLQVLQSDLFDALQENFFDIVLINPPYYPKTPATDYEHAWYCGENFDYFKKLFNQVQNRIRNESYFMILSDTCDINSITSIASNHNIQFSEITRKEIAGEKLTIYKLITA